MAIESRGDLASRHGSIGRIALLILPLRQSYLYQAPFSISRICRSSLGRHGVPPLSAPVQFPQVI